MPIQRSIDQQTRIVTTQCLGRMTDMDVHVDQRAFWTQDWVSGYGELFDMREADFSGLTGERSRYAPVVASNTTAAAVPVALLHDAADAAQVNLARRYVEGRLAQGGQPTCRAFTEAEAATAWLSEQLEGPP